MSKNYDFDPIYISPKDRRKDFAWFKQCLKRDGIADNTIESYLWTMRHYYEDFDGVLSPDNLITYKANLIDTYMPATVNARIHGMNRYLKEKDIDYRLKTIKIQQKIYLENVISMQDYIFLKKMLKEEGNNLMYFLVWFMACTGARISEAMQFKCEHLYDGIFPVYAKGGKYRVIFIPKQFQKECIKWLKSGGRKDGYIFILHDGKPINANQARWRLQKIAKRYGINPKVMHPHSFRHLFGKTFIDRGGGLVMLADILGHSNLETTRIYLKRTITETQEAFNKIVTW